MTIPLQERLQGALGRIEELQSQMFQYRSMYLSAAKELELHEKCVTEHDEGVGGFSQVRGNEDLPTFYRRHIPGEHTVRRTLLAFSPAKRKNKGSRNKPSGISDIEQRDI